MSRLIDNLLNAKPEARVHAALKAATVIVADNVAQYVYSDKRADMSHTRELPNIAPPLKNMFVEFRLPKPVGALGWYLQAFDRHDVDYLPFSGDIRAVDVDAARWMIRGMFYLEQYPKRPQMWCEVFVAPNGSLSLIGGTLEYFMRPTKDSVYAQAWQDDPYGKWMLGPAMAFNIALWTLCFMHTKNISMEDVLPPPKLNKAHVKRGHEPLAIYKVLKLTPMGARGDGESKGKHSSPSLHIVRGHFKHYTEDAPLFGHATGTYWWSQTLKGNRKVGTVEKAYQVVPHDAR